MREGIIPPSDFKQYQDPRREAEHLSSPERIIEQSRGEIDAALAFLERNSDGKGGYVNQAMRRQLELLKQLVPAIVRQGLKVVNHSRRYEQIPESENSYLKNYNHPDYYGDIVLDLAFASDEQTSQAVKNNRPGWITLFQTKLEKIVGDYKDKSLTAQEIEKLAEQTAQTLLSYLPKREAEVVKMPKPKAKTEPSGGLPKAA